MALPRQVDPEILDSISPNDPRAVHSRQDLRRLNALMFNARAMVKLLVWCWQHGKPPRRIVELGGGDATFMVAIAKRLYRRWPAVTILSVDRSSIVRDETREQVAKLGWTLQHIAADVFSFLDMPIAAGADMIVANLFLHHLEPDALSKLLSCAAARTSAIAACEPRRSPLTLLSSKLVFAIGANEITRHDASASVRAGFSDREISSLFPNSAGWDLREGYAPPFTHCFAARRVGEKHV